MKNEKIVRRLLIKSLPRFRYYFVLSFICYLAVQFIYLIPPVLMKRVIDDYIPTKNMRATFLSILLFAGIPTIVTILNTLYNYYLNLVGRKYGQKLMLLCFEKIVYQPTAYFDQHNSAEIASYAKTESLNYIVFWLFDLPQLIANMISGIVVFILLIKINLYIALVAFLYIPICILPSKYFAKKVDTYVKKIVDNNAKSNQIITDTCRGIKFIKAMVLENIQSEKVKRVNDETVQMFSKVAAIDNLNGSWTNGFVDNFVTFIAFALSALLIIKNQLSLGMLVLILNYLPRIFSVIKSAANTNFNFKKQLAQFDKFFDLLVMEDERSGYNLENKKFSFQQSIYFNDVSFCYNEERGNVLNKFSVNFEKGKWIGIIGNSGAGKSTVFDLLLKLYTDYSGEILVDHSPLKSISTMDLRSKITKVSQEMFLFPGTIKDNMTIIKPTASDDEIMKVLSLVGLDEFIIGLSDGIDTYIGEDGAQISGGEKQRLCLAQGLLRGSEMLLLDEVTANIDTISEHNIKKTIKKLMLEFGLTVISISHRLSFLDETDYIYMVKDGRIISKGTYKEFETSNELFNYNDSNIA